MMDINFRPPGPVARAFMLSDKFVRGLRGPVGSAKSSTFTMECLRLAMAQEPDANGVRKTRGAVIRNTNPMLRTTTLQTWRDWIPEALGQIRMHPPPFEQELDIPLTDGTRLAAQVYFLALDRPEDMKKLLSLELTWAWINEAREVGKTLVDGVTQRLRRFPRMQDGGPTRPGLIMDTNSPDDDHWWPIMSGEAPPPEGMSEEELRNLIRPDNWAFFTQPPAMLERREGGVLSYVVNPDAENIENLHPDYYSEQIKGKAKAYIDVYILNRYGATHDGRAVHPQFSRDVHVSSVPLEPWPGVPLIVSCDFGLTPAAVFRQKLRGRYQTLAEVVLTDGGANDLAAAINRVRAERFPGFTIVRGWGDPSGDIRSQADKKTAFQVMRAAGIPCRPCDTNDPEIRRGAGQAVLQRMIEGRPAELIDPSCKVLIAGLEGAWCYKRVAGAGEMFQDEPLKNRYSHVCEAWEYGNVGEGEGRALTGRTAVGAGRTVNVRSRSDPLDRFARIRRGETTSGISAWRQGARVP
jgi:hypothetical protein